VGWRSPGRSVSIWSAPWVKPQGDALPTGSFLAWLLSAENPKNPAGKPR
jgi:hypothetical protein